MTAEAGPAPDTAPRPFHVAGGALRARARRALLLSYHFPPSSTAGALRWQKLARHLADSGWGLDVITLSPDGLGAPDWARLEDLPDGTCVYGVPEADSRPLPVVGTLAAIARRLRRRRLPPPETGGPATGGVSLPGPAPRPSQLVRAYATLEDYSAQGRWARRAAALGLELATAHTHDAVLSCGPPHMVHHAGWRVARHVGLPFVMDLRDPWRLVERLAGAIDSPLWRWLAAWHERKVLPRADLVVMNTEAARDAMRRCYPRFSSRIIAVMNGVDEEAAPRGAVSSRFTVTYSGSIYLDRDPRPLFRAAARLVADRGLTPQQFGIVLVGHVGDFDGVPTSVLAGELGLGNYVETVSYLPRDQMLKRLGQSSVLVSLPQDSHMAVPSKIFEYMQFDAWLLAFAEPESATARLLDGTGAAVVSHRHVPGIVSALTDFYVRFERGERPRRLAADPRFGRARQAERLVSALESLRR